MHLTPDDLRIRQALEQIETPMYDIAGMVREQRARRSRRVPLRRPPRMLAAFIAALLVTATAAAAAVQLSGGWSVLFGQGVIVPDGLATPVYQTQTVDGCTVTLEDAIVTDGSVAVIYSLRYANASALYDDTYTTMLGNTSLLLDGKEDACLSSSGTGMTDGENRTVEYFYEAFSLSEDPGDRALTLEIGAAVLMTHSGTLAAPVDLAELYAAHPIDLSALDSGTQRLAALRQQDCADTVLPQTYQSPNVRFAGVGFADGTLCVALTMPDSDGLLGESAQIDALRDIRTGQLYYGGIYSYSSAENGLTLCESRFEGLTVDDLPYLEPQISYRHGTPLTEKGWSFTFRASSVPTLTRSLSLEGEEGMQIQRMTVSPLGVALDGVQPMSDSGSTESEYAPSIVLLLRDGSSVQTQAHGWSHSYDTSDAAESTFRIEYEFCAGAQSRRFLQTGTVTAVRIDNTTIAIEE